MLDLLKRLVRSPSPALLEVEAPGPDAPVSSLAVLNVRITAREPLEARLELLAEGQDEPLYSAPRRVGPAGETVRLTLHAHLLPEGVQRLRVRLLSTKGGLLAETPVTLTVPALNSLGATVAESLRRSLAPLVIDGDCDSGLYDYADPALRPWFDQPEDVALAHIAGLEASGRADADEAQALRHFVREGYLAMENVLGAEQLAALNLALDDAVATGREGYAWGSSQRLHSLHEHYPAVRDLWLHPKVLKMLDLIFGAPARPCQSLTYVFGSQQEHHQDTIHLTPFPAGYMCGVWTALEDVQPESGELMVFPRSHRLPRVYTRTVDLPKVRDEDWNEFGQTVTPYWTNLINDGGYAPEPYRPKAGSVLIWHENLMHGGSVRRDLEKSRRSIVCHYFAEGAVAYYDSSGLPGAMYMGPRG